MPLMIPNRAAGAKLRAYPIPGRLRSANIGRREWAYLFIRGNNPKTNLEVFDELEKYKNELADIRRGISPNRRALPISPPRAWCIMRRRQLPYAEVPEWLCLCPCSPRSAARC